MLESVMAFLKTLDWTQIIALIFAGGAGYVGIGGKIPSSLPKLGGDKSSDHGDLDALVALRKRAAASGCPMLQEAVHDVEVAFFNQGAK